MTLAEMRQGALDANWGPLKCDRLEAYLGDFSVLHSDSLLCSTWAQVRNESGRKGHQMSSADAWIAATRKITAIPQDYSPVVAQGLLIAANRPWHCLTRSGMKKGCPFIFQANAADGRKERLVRRLGLEPRTLGLKGRCSTD